MNYIQLFENFKALKEDEKILLHKIVLEIGDNTSAKIDTNSEVSLPNKRGHREVEGLGKPFSSIVPNTVNKKDGSITADIEHGVEYESGRRDAFVSTVVVDIKSGEYTLTRK